MGACFSHEDECISFPKAIAHSNGLPIEEVYTLKKKLEEAHLEQSGYLIEKIIQNTSSL